MQTQKEFTYSTNGGGQGAAPIASSAFTTPDQLLCSSPLYYLDEEKFLDMYSAVFPPKDAPASLSSSSLSCEDEETSSEAVTDDCLYLARLTLQYRKMEDRYKLCLSHLQDAAEEVNTLRQENFRLRKANTDLAKRLNPRHQVIPVTPLQYKHPSIPLSIVNDLRRLSLACGGESSPTSVLGYRDITPRQSSRLSLPKSISVRSSGYNNAAGAAQKSRSKVRATNPALAGSQRVYVPAPAVVQGIEHGREEEALEFDVYGQGMLKTELCNKWEETGACPYGDHCQFAHGIAELRPIIRHPRYKTEVCRMVLGGERCPYGHRCHFRHTIVPSDRINP